MITTLENRILFFVILLLAVTVAINTFLSADSFQREHRNSLLTRSRNLGLEIKKEMEAGSHVESLLGFVSLDPQLPYCLIEGPSGAALFATVPELLSPSGETVKYFSPDAASFRHAELGEIYLVTIPLVGEAQEIIGRVRVGFSGTSLSAVSHPAIIRSLLLFAIAFPIVLVLTLFFLRRYLITPLRRLGEIAREISQGHFPLSSPPLSGRELSDLGCRFQEMSLSLKQRDEAILEGYKELERTHVLLRCACAEQERTGAELKHTQEMFLNLFENATDAIVISDQDDRIVLFNRQAEQFFGVKRKKVIGRNLLKSIDLLRGDVRSQDQLFKEFLDKGSYESELEYFRPGECAAIVGWVRATIARDQEGKHWVQAIIRDITQERQVKENLQRSTRELERLNQMKDSFLGLASHELKTPLTVIVGYADLILTEKDSYTDETVLAMVRNISEAGDRLTGIVRDMVDVTKLDSQRLPLNLQEADINDFIRSVANDHLSFLKLRSQRLDLQLGLNLPPVFCDVVRLKQAFGNLIGNAIKFTPDKGCITIESRLSSESSHEAEKWVDVVIRDTGIGIAPNDQLHIFDKFYEAGSIEEHFTEKYAFKGKGTGLGLSIAKGIIEMHGGRITVESSGYDPEGCPGSTFHLLFPAASAVSPR